MNLSVAAQLSALRDYAEKNGYLTAREYVNEVESGPISDRPEFRKMTDEATEGDSNCTYRNSFCRKFPGF